MAKLRPAEYWESHAGAASYLATVVEDSPERLHGVHTFLRVAEKQPALAESAYCRMLKAGMGMEPARIFGSPRFALGLMGQAVRRLLFCDLDAESLRSIVQFHQASKGGATTMDKIECVQDDGVSVLRGAGILLPEPWIASTAAFLDPYEMAAETDSGISPLELFTELAGRGMLTLMFYAFDDEAEREQQRGRIVAALEKKRLLNHGVRRFEGSLMAAGGAGAGEKLTQWGFGMLVAGANAAVCDAIDRGLRALEHAYQGAELAAGIGGQWRYVSATI